MESLPYDITKLIIDHFDTQWEVSLLSSASKQMKFIVESLNDKFTMIDFAFRKARSCPIIHDSDSYRYIVWSGEGDDEEEEGENEDEESYDNDDEDEERRDRVRVNYERQYSAFAKWINSCGLGGKKKKIINLPFNQYYHSSETTPGFKLYNIYRLIESSSSRVDYIKLMVNFVSSNVLSKSYELTYSEGLHIGNQLFEKDHTFTFEHLSKLDIVFSNIGRTVMFSHFHRVPIHLNLPNLRTLGIKFTTNIASLNCFVESRIYAPKLTSILFEFSDYSIIMNQLGAKRELYSKTKDKDVIRCHLYAYCFRMIKWFKTQQQSHQHQQHILKNIDFKFNFASESIAERVMYETWNLVKMYKLVNEESVNIRLLFNRYMLFPDFKTTLDVTKIRELMKEAGCNNHESSKVLYTPSTTSTNTTNIRLLIGELILYKSPLVFNRNTMGYFLRYLNVLSSTFSTITNGLKIFKISLNIFKECKDVSTDLQEENEKQKYKKMTVELLKSVDLYKYFTNTQINVVLINTT